MSEDDFSRAFHEMANGVCLIKAALNHWINYLTLSNRFNGKHNKPNGRQTKLPVKIEC